MVRAVSMRDSPFWTLDVETLKLSTSAERRFAATEKDVSVRVEFS